MRSYPYIPTMVQAITVLTVLKMMTKAETSCGSGSMNGKVMYERLPNIQLQGFDEDIVRDTAPPFMVLEKCEDLCLRDRSSNNIVRPCASFDFQPGSRISTNYNGGPEYEESTCYLTSQQARPEGLGTLMLVPNSVHFNEICLESNRPERECPNRRYVFERHPHKKLKLPTPDIKETQASNRSECEDKCLNEFSFVCRSASYDSGMGTCALSRFTRRTHPELLEDDPDSDYLENTCLNSERRCEGLAVFIKEEGKRMSGPFEVDSFTNLTVEDCQSMCVRAEKYLCRSIEYDEMTKQCILSEEDSVSQKDDIRVASSPTHHYYDFVCLDSPRGSEYPDNSVTSHLFSSKKPDTAFQRYRNRRLGGEHHSEISGRSLSECLDECLRQPSFQCRSAEYSDRFRTCRLTRYNQRDGMRLIYDADYDYYENLMLGGDGEGTGQRPGESDSGGYRPGYPDSHRPHSGGGMDRFPPGPTTSHRHPLPSGGHDYDRPPPRRPSYDRYPEYDDRYPVDRYPTRPNDGYSGSGRFRPSSERYPSGDRYPLDDYPRYPSYPPSSSGAHYPPGRLPEQPYYSGGGRYGSRYGDRYGDRYDYRHDSKYGDRYDDRFRNKDRYGGGYRDDYGGRYGGEDRYIGGGSRYGNRHNDRYSGNRFDYDDRDAVGGGRWFARPDRRPAGRPVDGRPVYDISVSGRPVYDRPIDGRPVYDRPIDGRPVYDRPIDGRPVYDRPVDPRPVYDRPGLDDRPSGHRRPISPGPDGPIYDSFGGIGPGRPYSTRCDEGDSFKQMGTRQRMRKDYVRRSVIAPSLSRCQQECIDSRDFICRSFNYRDAPSGTYDTDRDNCELSDRDTRDMEIGNPQYFDNTGNYDYYERSMDGRQGVDGDCLDVQQVCNEDGMEFTLRTPEGFYGRIYTYGFYDRCFFRGNGGTVNVLRISGAQGYPECGTQRYGDTMTNIVVVQLSDFVQTAKDKRFNLTCLFRGPGEAVVTSGFIGAGSGSPIPIEYLPAENTISSKVRLLILYQGRPTTTIAVGDPLTFRIEAQDGYNYATDIFATNVVARDPYSGRSVQLIDRYGCPVDSFVFPELDKGRSGDSLEARFNAFKIPESNFLVFEATVRTCRDGCQPAYCQTGSGRSEPSFGRRRRSINDTITVSNVNLTNFENITVGSNDTTTSVPNNSSKIEQNNEEDPEFVQEMIEVFDSREEMQQEARRAEPVPETVCLTPGEYQGLVSALLALVAVLLTIALLAGLAYRKYWTVMRKNLAVDRISSSNFSTSSSSYPNTRSSGLSTGISIFGANIQRQFVGLSRPGHFPSLPKDDLECPGPAPGGPFEDPSEPIYIDPSLFERSRSLRSIAVSPKRRPQN